MKARRRGRGRTWAVSLPQPQGPGRTDRRLGFVRARWLQRGSVRLPAACSPPPLAPPPGLQLLFNIHLEKLNLASWKPAHSQIPGDFQSLSFSPARDATFPLAEAFEKPSSCVPASPSLCRGGPAAHPDPRLGPKEAGGHGGLQSTCPDEPGGVAPVAARCPVSGSGDTGRWPSYPGQWGLRGRREGDFLEGPTGS